MLLYHYTDSESLVEIVKDKLILATEGSVFDQGAKESVFFTTKDPLRFSRRQILENNYARWHWTLWTDVRFGKKAAKVSWYIEVTVNEDENFKFKDAERKCSRPGDIVYHEGDLHLSQYKWQFGKTPFYSDDVYNLDPDLEALDSATAAQPNIAGHPNNKEYKMPSRTDFPLTLRPTSAFIHRQSKKAAGQS